MIKVARIEGKSAAAKSDAEVVFVFQDGGKKAIAPKGPYKGIVEKYRKSGDTFTAKVGQVQYLPFQGKGAKHAILVGAGQAKDLTAEKMRIAGSAVLGKLAAEKAKSVSVLFDGLIEDPKSVQSDIENAMRGFAEGFALSAYRFDKYKKKEEGQSAFVGPEKVTLVSKNKALAKSLPALAKDVMIVAECVNVTRDWSNEPTNYGTPEYFAEEAKRYAKELGITCKVLSEADAKKENMNLFLAVGQGSERQGKIVVLDYHPKGAEKTIALVGKGITMDTGGISIKPSMRMEDMKHDMTGAATLFGATILAARRKLNKRVICILAFTENMPDGDAITPGCVITGRSGKTVEIINTDAEGRLILADALDYAQDFKPDCVVNAATLTGAVVVALGKQCCGLMTNDEALGAQLIAAGKETHERMWQLPLYDEYFEDLKTDCADMKNSANDGTGGTIRGGIFLKQFIRKGQSWAHLDIAATAYGMGHVPYYPKKGGSGMHVRAVAKFIENY